ncbi:hypothetical protein CNMCM6106_007560 [Aspergillus hiratsukae]|uniref:Uncharacterized protein n=1 Tax=Aspergillus hiratsukae TaxID=1194566 RepID=A0A8H6QGL8_9EURO|nr:hypothetical protein CNMCM6106_007560 [Aspergillus hiratsukae]
MASPEEEAPGMASPGEEAPGVASPEEKAPEATPGRVCAAAASRGANDSDTFGCGASSTSMSSVSSAAELDEFTPEHF